jgi:2-oxoglutarate ferredoxin oxidoreductase subunit alpha
MDHQEIEPTTVSIALTGSGGAGVMTAGGLLFDAAAKFGCYGLQTRSVGPQIRGGEAAALIRLSDRPVETHGDSFDILFALDWSNYSRFAAEIALTAKSVVIADADAGEVPVFVRNATDNIIEFPLKTITESVPGGRANMVSLGVIASAIGIPLETVTNLVCERLASKGGSAVESSTAAMALGYRHGASLGSFPKVAAADLATSAHRWLLTGNEAAALGAIRGGVRFAAAYPITPATEILEWLAPALRKVGGTLVQAEDELASINMIIGASFGGVPALTATSGPGFALMTESIGLATAAEVPVVIVDVMRGGPSTGIPTKSEQSDLNIAIYGLHGDAPHLVVAPVSLADCLFTTQWAVHLAEAMQAPAVVLSDQFFGQARMIVDRPADVAFIANRRRAERCSSDYARYALTADGVSPMAIPGTAGGQYTADGLEHAPSGTPSSRAEDHLSQLAKRRDKIDNFDYGTHWAEIDGDGDFVIITWGSTSTAVREAANVARAHGVHVKTIAVRLLAPLKVDALMAEIDGARRVLVIEQTDSGQFYRYLRSQCDLPADTRAVHHSGPLSVTPAEVHFEIMRDHQL